MLLWCCCGFWTILLPKSPSFNCYVWGLTPTQWCQKHWGETALSRWVQGRSWSRFRSVFETSSCRCCLVLLDLFLHVWIAGCECSSPDAQCWLLRRMGKDLKVLTDEWSPVAALWWLEASTLCRALFRQRERDLRKAFRLFDKVIWVHAILFKGSK